MRTRFGAIENEAMAVKVNSASEKIVMRMQIQCTEENAQPVKMGRKKKENEMELLFESNVPTAPANCTEFTIFFSKT